MKRRWVAGLLVPVTIMLAGCDPEDLGSDGSPSVSTRAGGGKPGPAGCEQPGPRVGQWLPAFDRSNAREATIRSLRNPCPPFSELVGLVTDALPAADSAHAQTGKFVKQVRGLAGRFLTVVDVTKCGYETDRLAVGIYQHHDHPLSVGVVVVVRGRFGLVADVVACYLGGQIRSGDSVRSEGTRPVPQFCALSGMPSRDDEDYALVALGSSNWMCSALRRSMPQLSVQVSL